MADRRLELHSKLVSIMEPNNVYFQPPESIKLSYPCMVYKRESARVFYANDMPYSATRGYEITIIDQNPDSEFIEKMQMALPTVRYNRHYVSENLNHDTFTVYY